MTEFRDIELLVHASTPIIVMETHEEHRVLEKFRKVALDGRRSKPLFRWTVTEGLRRLDVLSEPQRHNARPAELLAQIKSTERGGIYILFDFHPFLEDPLHVRALKDIALAHERVDHTIVLASHQVSVPGELEHFCARVNFSVPDRGKLEAMIVEEARKWSQANPGKRVKAEREALDLLAQNLVGLALEDARRLARGAIHDDGVLTAEELPEVMKAKFDLLNQGGVLSFAYDTARFAEVGGLAGLKRWLELRRRVFTDGSPLPGLDPPRGIMLLGVQGCGKSLAAKAVAGTWNVPLLQLDFGALYNKFHGETERNLRESLKTAETMAPCVLWVDEIEKGVSNEGGMDGGTSKRVLGTLLTWLAEHKTRVFIVATANDIEALPPELLRKGRLDEVFFVDLPDHETRRLIFEIHLRKRELDPAGYDLEALATETEGFSGSELEQVVVASLYAAYAQHTKPGSAHLFQEISRTRPLSVLMAEKIEYLRSWAAGRTVLAN